MSKTEKDLMDAFAGESQANRRYLAYSQRAEDEFLHGVAKLFRAIAEAETIHAIKHLRTADKVKSTKENLEDAIAGETHEFKTMYPEMIAHAKEEGHNRPKSGSSTQTRWKPSTLSSIKKRLPIRTNFRCRITGSAKFAATPQRKKRPDVCPVCGANTKAFFKV